MHILPRQPSDAAPARIRPLSVLPVFYDLAGRRAVVAGGSAGAAWKAELIAAAGADLHVYAPREVRCDEFARLAGREQNVTLHDRRWETDDLREAVLAVADAEGEAEAERFRAAARMAGAACNVIDKPAFCDFQFGAIVNRSPAVIGISTAGAAPVLGQAIRRRIEALLPPSLAQWTALARDWRGRVNDRLAMGARRRAFWERFSDRAFGPAPTEEIELDRMIDEGGSHGEGHVAFVGAGPGDAELLTLKAMRVLQAADVILFDDLVCDDVLELARREARRIRVGKRAGGPGCKQHEINDMMIALAKAGRRVVRLKSGDPTIFGRAGEEMEALRAAGIGFDVVPGITTGLAMASASGMSLYKRAAAEVFS
nr:siroheme synthase CysG [Nitratireductor soli]